MIICLILQEITCYHVAKHGVVALTKSQGRREIYAATGIRYVCICPWFTETNILTHDPEMFNKVKDAIGDSNIMTVDKVSGAFVNLIKDGYNGSAIVIMPKMEPFYWPFLAEVAIFAWLCLGSFVCTKLLRIRVFGPWHQLAYFVITILFLNYLFRMLLGFVF